MCGIVAAFGRVDTARCERMLDRVRHRGPDDKGALVLPTAWLGHQRLSIIDVMGGHPTACGRAGRARPHVIRN